MKGRRVIRENVKLADGKSDVTDWITKKLMQNQVSNGLVVLFAADADATLSTGPTCAAGSLSLIWSNGKLVLGKGQRVTLAGRGGEVELVASIVDYDGTKID